MASWAVCPIFTGEGTPTAANVEAEGISVGGNMVGRSRWLLCSHDVPFCKIAYWYFNGYYYIAAAVKQETWTSSMKLYSLSYINGVYALATFDFTNPLGDMRYRSGSPSLTQAIVETLNPQIPAYGSQDLALAALNDGVWEVPQTDPYSAGGLSGSGGGAGAWADDDIAVTVPALPTVSASDTGFITLFTPSLAQLRDLAAYMWSSLFDVSGWQKIFADPSEAILGLSIVPVDVSSSVVRPVKVGNISTNVNMTVASSQYVSVSCGSLAIPRYFDAYIDYEPYTKFTLVLPYVGAHDISADDIIGKTLGVTYHIDVLSGALIAYVTADNHVLYEFTGQCAASIPVTGDNFTRVVNGMISIAGVAATAVATNGASLSPATAVSVASTVVNSGKPQITRSGSITSAAGLLGIQVPFLITTRPRPAIPRDQNLYMGYPAFMTVSLASLSGYTEIENIHLEDIPATDAELDEIESLLKSGVIF